MLLIQVFLLVRLCNVTAVSESVLHTNPTSRTFACLGEMVQLLALSAADSATLLALAAKEALVFILADAAVLAVGAFLEPFDLCSLERLACDRPGSPMSK